MSCLNQIEEQLLCGVHASGAPSDIPTAIRIDYDQRVGTRTTYLEGGGVHRVPVVIPGFSLILRTVQVTPLSSRASEDAPVAINTSMSRAFDSQPQREQDNIPAIPATLSANNYSDLSPPFSDVSQNAPDTAVAAMVSTASGTPVSATQSLSDPMMFAPEAEESRFLCEACAAAGTTCCDLCIDPLSLPGWENWLLQQDVMPVGNHSLQVDGLPFFSSQDAADSGDASLFDFVPGFESQSDFLADELLRSSWSPSI